MDDTAIQNGSGIGIDIGTRIGIPTCTIIKGIFVRTVTTAEHVSYLVGTIDIDAGLGYGSGITTAIDILDTRITTAVDDDMRLLASRCIVSQISASIDSSKFVSSIGAGLISSFRSLRTTRYRLPDRHRHIT